MDNIEIIRLISSSVERTLNKQQTSEVTEHTMIKELGIDSLLLFKFVTELEVHFQIEFDDLDIAANHFTTVGSVIQVLQKYPLGN